MKVVFLDVDGVLNRLDTIERLGITGLEPDCLARLGQILEATGAVVVLSSTWRLDAGMRSIVAAALDGLGARVVGDTPCHEELPRGEEIVAWVELNDVERYAVLDDLDEAGAGLERAPQGRLFLTDVEVGLTDEIAAAVVRYLDA